MIHSQLGKMYRLTMMVATFLLFHFCSVAQNFNIELLSHIPIGEDGSDIWGFTDANQTEYAVIGKRSATLIYSLEDPKNPILMYTAGGAISIWRDIKYYNNHLYVTHDQDTFGLTIIDVSKAPDTFSQVQWKPTLTIGATTTRFNRAHNLYIDEKGFAYISGHNISSRGVMIVDLNQDPNSPTYVGAANLFYSHDAFVKNDTLYSSELSNGFGIYDVRDKSNPIEIGRAKSGNNFTHNAWLSDTSKILFTTDEVPGGYVESYDVSDPKNIKFLDRFKTNPGQTRVIPHNTHILGKYAVTSWYTDGVIINDVSDPKNIVKVGGYDTYTGSLPATGSLYLGCWGAYPFLPSGIIICSDINSGLWVFKPSYVEGAYLTGNIFAKDSASLGLPVPVNGATVKVLNSDINRFINGNEYKIGISPDSTIRVVFSHPDYSSDTVSIELMAGQTQLMDHYFLTNLSTSTAENRLKKEFVIFPNPTDKLLNVSSEYNGNVYQIYDTTGKLIKTGKINFSVIDVQSIASGLYNIKVLVSDRIFSQSFYKL